MSGGSGNVRVCQGEQNRVRGVRECQGMSGRAIFSLNFYAGVS